MIRHIATLILVTACLNAHAQLLDFSEAEVRAILRHGPWPVEWSPDPSNRVSANADAIALGKKLFFDPRLSSNGKVSCATCHDPARAWQDGRPTAFGHQTVDRNTPSVLNVRLNRWFGWDGAHDNLWSQSLRPILDKREMASSPRSVSQLIRSDRQLRALYGQTFRAALPPSEETLLVNVAKSLAAFQETLVSGRTPFDEFRDALARGDKAAAARYPAAAQRGLKLFVGNGNCAICHFGPNFTNGEFADIGVPFFIEPGRVDHGRHRGIERLKQSRFNLLGPYNDDGARRTATTTRHVVAQHRNFGEFRVPALRNVALTAPYMHNGRVATLRDVVRHYSEIDLERLHADGERILRPLNLNDGEIDDLIAFLESLTATPTSRP